ncbi:MAG TPA: TonB-dependent receptor, partial [Bryobacteraceae bacterium]|nr:TonB-dependent receptor [Bryobacteraceae bacterium]
MVVVALCAAATAFAQGVLTGTIADPGRRVVPRARVLAREVKTGAQHQTTSTARGVYTLTSLPAGEYELNVLAAGFRRFVLQGIGVGEGRRVRVDVFLETGFLPGTAASVYEAPLLRTEGTDLGTAVSADVVDALPLERPHVRNPLDFVTFAPGVTGSAGEAGASPLHVNGYPSTTYRVALDGQDITSPIDPSRTLEQQPSVAALSEFVLRTGSTAAEFGQTAGGLVNLVSRGGAAPLHGSFAAFARHEWLNAGRPFSDNGSGGHVRPRARDLNLGGNLGGPFVLPRIYDGRERTFFFLNMEHFRARGEAAGSYSIVPTEAYRRGDFSAALTGRSLGKDPLGRDILENMIYDPLSSRTVNGQELRDPFAGNRIDAARFDPVAVKLQSLIPQAGSGLVNNFEIRYPRREDRDIPSIKIDHSIAEDARVSFFYSGYSHRAVAGQDGLPAPLTGSRNRRLLAHTFRMNGDYTVTPTLLAHAGFGYVRWINRDDAIQSVLDYPVTDPVKGIGLAGGLFSGMPRVAIGVGAANRGGMAGVMGTGSRARQYADKPSAVASLTYLVGNHTYKAGGEARQDIWSF